MYVCSRILYSNSSFSFHNTHTFKYCTFTHTYQYLTYVSINVHIKHHTGAYIVHRTHTHIHKHTHRAHVTCSLVPWLGGRDQAYIMDNTGTTHVHTTHTHHTNIPQVLGAPARTTTVLVREPKHTATSENCKQLRSLCWLQLLLQACSLSQCRRLAGSHSPLNTVHDSPLTQRSGELSLLRVYARV